MTEQRLAITRMGWRGEGIADGPVYVAYALPGETVLAAVSGERGVLLAVETASPQRVAPFCPHFGACGGCQLQHWAPAPYGAWKAAQVTQAFAKRGLAVTVAGPVDAHGAGRRRVSLHGRRKDGVAEAGFMAARSHALHDLDHCPILVAGLREAPAQARAIAAALGDCDVAMTATDSGVDTNVKAERKVAAAEHAKLAGLAERLDLARLAVNGEAIVTRRAPVIAMGKAQVTLAPGSFLQATAAGEAALASLVTAALPRAKRIADLFCGLGPFTFRLAERARVSALDSDRPAIAALALAARQTQGLKPIAAAARDLMREPLVAGELKDFDAVVFDPPRAGAEAQARQLAKSAVKTVVAVSCDPETLARDAAILTGGGYRIAAVTAVDQFKWSSHVETVAVFVKP